MSRVNRLIHALAISFLALGPVSAAAAATPSPGLDTVLVAPPSGYTELTSSPFHGSFTAHDYATASDEAHAADIEKTLNHDGFVGGYGKTWVSQAAQRAMVEAVIAFTGGRGAKDWLTAAEAGDKTDPTYAHADSISGISPYYGGHFKYSSDNTVGDVFSFVKGNDVFIVGLVSTKDDVLSLATTQTKAQYDQAPGQTIPSSQWPENASSASSGSFPVLAVGIIGVLIILAVVAVVAVTMRRRGGMTPALADAPGAYAAPGAMGSPAAGNVQMSTDGKYWWDGQSWRDAAAEAPPSAQRSGDGALWWDGQTWRPVPQAGQAGQLQQPEQPPTA